MSSRNQIVIITPFTLAGAMAPVTLAGALAQQNAEALAGIVMTQLVRPGSPVVYGGFTSNVDMKSGAPAFGTPEYMKTAIIGGQLARRYNVPYRTSGVSASNTVDAQAAYESVFSLWGTTMGGGNIIKHSAGWMEGGLVASFEKLVLDVDLLQMVSTDRSSTCLSAFAFMTYTSQDNLYIASHLQANATQFHKISLSDLQYQASGKVDGQIGWRGNPNLRIDEQDDHLRVVSSDYSAELPAHKLTILSQQETIHSLLSSFVQAFVPLIHFWVLSPYHQVLKPG